MTKIYYTIFNLIALAGIIYLGVDGFYRISMERLNKIDTQEITTKRTEDTVRQTKPRLSDYNAIDDRNLFSKIKPSASDNDTPDVENLDETSLKIRLLGTATGNQDNAAAFIEDTSKRTQGLYYIGDSIQQGIVKSILSGKVVLSVGNKDEILIMEETDSSSREESSTPSRTTVVSTETSSPLERTITIRDSDIEESLDNISELLSQASIRVHTEDGETDGLAITGIKAGSIFRKMGLRNGDIIKGVSGSDITSPEDLISLYNDLKSESDVSMQIVRRGTERILNYTIRD